MARSLGSLATPVALQEGTEIVHLIEINHSGGTLRWTTHSLDVDADVGSGVVTWTAIGGLLSWEAVEETTDPSGQGTTLRMSGVDTTIISAIRGNELRGRAVKIYLAHLGSDGQVTGTLELFRGFQNREYRVRETRSQDGQERPTAEVTTRIVSRLAELQQTRMVRMNVTSHRAMLDRAGVAGDDSDTFFEKVITLDGKTHFWGTDVPVTGAGGGTGSGDPGDGRRYF